MLHISVNVLFYVLSVNMYQLTFKLVRGLGFYRLSLEKKVVESSARNLPSASNQNLDVLCSNRAFLTDDNDALETLQTKGVGQQHVTGSQVPDASASAQAPINELPRNSESKEDVAVASAQPSKSRQKRSPRATTSKNTAMKREFQGDLLG
ncbi:hypothetical protein M9H77_01414 [Catharanthus roseus]|uniref:Uncharacterized protein n=1 Tax=Catharanthus roseus TaxID=4058 RepID=A0ACC0C5Q0_CATRO|nr:hypothetical protein M9H77_01414 [Catharanthus roseus]